MSKWKAVAFVPTLPGTWRVTYIHTEPNILSSDSVDGWLTQEDDTGQRRVVAATAIYGCDGDGVMTPVLDELTFTYAEPLEVGP